MRYIYTVFKQSLGAQSGISIREKIETGIRIDRVNAAWYQDPYLIVVHDAIKNQDVCTIRNQDDYEGWLECLQREAAWAGSPKVLQGYACGSIAYPVPPVDANSIVVKKDHINPSHYQGYIQTEHETLQWLEAMQYLPHFRNPVSFCAAVELQVRKYMDRSGGKDDEVQEAQKALWYHKFLVAYMKNGNKPIRVAQIDEILSRKG